MTNQVKVGIFSTISIAIFILGFYFLKGINVFQRKNVYYAVYDRVDGLYTSNIVEVNGFKIGRVGTMKRDPKTGKIVVELDLDKDVKVPNSDSTVALLVSTDFLGSKKVNMVFGESDTFMQDGDTINTLFKKDLTEQFSAQIDPIMIMVRDMLPALDSTIQGIRVLFDVNDSRSIFTTVDKVNNAVSKVDNILGQNQQTLSATIKNLEAFTDNLQKNNATLNVIIKNAASVSDSIQQANLKQTIENLNTTINQLKSMLQGINEGRGTLGKIVKDDVLYAKVDSAVGSLNTLLKDVKARPYRYISINVLGSKRAEKRREKEDNEAGK